MDKRYQVFVSSTYADLKDERQRVLQTLMELDCIPAGMELFPATDVEQFEFIKRVIDDCDYYLLIIGGRYGSIAEEGISYTEKEYDYASAKGLHVIALIHDRPDDISIGKSEKDPNMGAKLQDFRAKVSTGRLVRYWNSPDQLPGLVALNISKAVKSFPAVGWVRANRAASEDLLNEINLLRKENQKLQAAATETGPLISIQDLAGLDELFLLSGTYEIRGFSGVRSWSTAMSWSEIFSVISPYLAAHPSDSRVKMCLRDAAHNKYGATISGAGSHHSVVLNDQIFQTVSVQLQALGLVTTTYTSTVQGGMGLFWSITSAGKALMLKVRAIRSVKNLDLPRPKLTEDNGSTETEA